MVLSEFINSFSVSYHMAHLHYGVKLKTETRHCNGNVSIECALLFDSSVDRQLLLKFLHCCDSGSCSPDVQQGAAASLLLSLQHRLDLSCCSAVDLTEETQEPPLHLRPEDCRVIAMVIKRVRANPELSLMDCDVEEAGLEDLFSVLDIIRLR